MKPNACSCSCPSQVKTSVLCAARKCCIYLGSRSTARHSIQRITTDTTSVPGCRDHETGALLQSTLAPEKKKKNTSSDVLEVCTLVLRSGALLTFFLSQLVFTRLCLQSCRYGPFCADTLQPGAGLQQAYSQLCNTVCPSCFSPRLCSACSYAASDTSVLDTYNEAQAFSKLSAAATRVAQQQSEMAAADIASMYIALLGFTGKVYPDRLDYTDRVLTESFQVCLSDPHGKPEGILS